MPHSNSQFKQLNTSSDITCTGHPDPTFSQPCYVTTINPNRICCITKIYIACIIHSFPRRQMGVGYLMLTQLDVSVIVCTHL